MYILSLHSLNKNLRCYLFLLAFLFFNSIGFAQLKKGTYRAVLYLRPTEGIELPFNFDVVYKKNKPTLIIKNADERISVTEITIKKDSVNFKMPVFDTEFKTKLVGDTLIGYWKNNYKKENNTIPFKAFYNQSQRFNFLPGKANPLFEGKWQTIFSPNTKDSSKAIGVFHHTEQTDYVTGTFLTETGDYRYLEGMRHNNELHLSCFDGSHAFLFVATLSKDTLQGTFYSGKTWKENFVATNSPNAELRNANEITLLKNKDLPIQFSFKDVNGKLISINDEKFKNKPLLIQVMGSWCPNCMDETAYLSELYSKNNKKEFEIIALAFEKTTDEEKAKSQVTRLIKKFNVPYTVLLTGLTGKDKASETLSALNKITAFPTLLFLNRQHQIIKIHTGFSGPATGKNYNIFKEETESTIKFLTEN